MPPSPGDLATVVLSRAIRAGKEEAFDAWVGRVAASAAHAPGYLASLRLGQTQGLQHLIYRFDGHAAAEGWRGSDEHRHLEAEADDFSVGLDQLKAGDPVVFELPSDASASKWKRFVTTWIAVFPILLVVSGLMRLLLKDVPPWAQLIPSSLILTAALQWVVLPRLQRWTRFWVLKGTHGELRK